MVDDSIVQSLGSPVYVDVFAVFLDLGVEIDQALLHVVQEVTVLFLNECHIFKNQHRDEFFPPPFFR